MLTCGHCLDDRSSSGSTHDSEYVIIHRCLDCGFERFNRIAADDDVDLVLALPEVPARTSRDVKARKVEEYLAEGPGWWAPGGEEAG